MEPCAVFGRHVRLIYIPRAKYSRKEDTLNMKTWTNPSVEELEVKLTAGGEPWWFWEDLVYGPVDDEDTQDPGTPPVTPPVTPPEQPGRDETTDGHS